MKISGNSGRPGERRVHVGGETKLTVGAALKWILAAVVVIYVVITACVLSRNSGVQTDEWNVADTGARVGTVTDVYDLESLLMEGLPSKPRNLQVPLSLASGGGSEQRTADEERAAMLLAEAQRLLSRAMQRHSSLRGSGQAGATA